MKTKIYFETLILVASVFGLSSVRAEHDDSLTLQRYLEQVREGHKGIRGSLETSRAAQALSDEGGLLKVACLRFPAHGRDGG